MERWEYMAIHWLYSSRFVPGSAPDKEEQQWRGEYFLRRPGAEIETHLQHDFGEEPKVSFLDLLAELGAEGWELVSETALSAAAVTGTHGWSDVGMPIEIRWTLKRRGTQA